LQDIHVPDELHSEFKDFPPIFANTEVPFEAIGSYMQEVITSLGKSTKPKKQLVSGMKAKNILFDAELLRWYLCHGLVVTRMHLAMEYTPCRMFKKLVDTMTEKRRQAVTKKDVPEEQKCKLTTNTCYGQLLTDKEKYSKIEYVDNETDLIHLHRQPTHKHSQLINNHLYEVEMRHKKLDLDIPIHLGKAVLDRAKLRMLEWVHDYLNVYLLPGSYQAIQMDTDSFYCAYAMEINHAKLDEKSDEFDLNYHPFEQWIRPHLMEQWRALIWSQTDCCYDEWVPDYTRHFEPRRCCSRHNTHDQKTPFLFKLEAWGTSMTALSSKTYSLVKSDGGSKYATKGVQKTAIQKSLAEGEGVYDKMKDALQSKTCGHPVTNVSLRMDHKQKEMSTMSVKKAPYNIIYTKRVVQPNGIDTAPLDITLQPPIRRDDPIGYNPNDSLQVPFEDDDLDDLLVDMTADWQDTPPDVKGDDDDDNDDSGFDSDEMEALLEMENQL
jgi:hypothetical protein